MPDLNEAKTRALLINPQLEKLAGIRATVHRSSSKSLFRGVIPLRGMGFSDFSLYSPDGTVLAVIEAKRTARNAREGEEQLRQYVAEIAAKQKFPSFGFMTSATSHRAKVGPRPPKFIRTSRSSTS